MYRFMGWISMVSGFRNHRTSPNALVGRMASIPFWIETPEGDYRFFVARKMVENEGGRSSIKDPFASGAVPGASKTGSP